MLDFLMSILDVINSTQIPDQIRTVDAIGLFTNGYFLVIFISYLGFKLYKQDFNSLVIVGLCIGLWLFSGSHFMQGLIVNGELQIGKVLPVVAVFMGAIGVAIYFLFMRAD